MSKLIVTIGNTKYEVDTEDPNYKQEIKSSTSDKIKNTFSYILSPEFLKYFIPGVNTIAFAKDANNTATSATLKFKSGQYKLGIGDIFLTTSNILNGAASLFPFVGGVQKGITEGGRIIKGVNTTFGKDTDILNRITHPITTIRVGDLSSKISKYLPKELLNDFTNTLQNIRYSRKGPGLNYSPNDNTINGLLSIDADNFGLAHELGHVATKPIYKNTTLNTFYNISAPKNYIYELNRLTPLHTIQDEFYADLLAAKTTKRAPLFSGKNNIYKNRYNTVKDFVNLELFTPDINLAKIATPKNYSINELKSKSNKDYKILETFRNNYLNFKSDPYATKEELNSVLERAKNWSLDYGLNPNEVIEFIMEKKQGGNINYLNLFK